MASILIQFPSDTGIIGESTKEGYVDAVEAMGLRECVEVGVGSSGSAGKARHSDIEVVRYKDSASPKLAVKCGSASKVGQVRINLFRTIGTGEKVYLEYLLEETYISRIEQETLDSQHVAFRPHLAEQTRGLPLPGAAGLATALGSPVADALASSRLILLPMEQTEKYTNLELERIYLNFTKVEWTYTIYDAQGVKLDTVPKGFDLVTSKAFTSTAG